MTIVAALPQVFDPKVSNSLCYIYLEQPELYSFLRSHDLLCKSEFDYKHSLYFKYFQCCQKVLFTTDMLFKLYEKLDAAEGNVKLQQTKKVMSSNKV